MKEPCLEIAAVNAALEPHSNVWQSRIPRGKIEICVADSQIPILIDIKINTILITLVKGFGFVLDDLEFSLKNGRVVPHIRDLETEITRHHECLAFVFVRYVFADDQV